MSEARTHIQFVLDLATNAGVAADVTLNSSSQLTLKAEAGSLSQYTVASSHAMGLRIISDGRVGTSYTESLAPDTLRNMFAQAMSNARIARQNEHERIRAQLMDFSPPSPDVHQIEDVPLDEKIEAALRLEAGILSKPKAATAPYNSFSDVTTFSYVGNTNGVFGEFAERSVSCMTSALISLDGKQAMHFAQRSARSFLDLSIDDCVDEAYVMAEALLEGRPIRTGSYDVVMTTDVLKQFFGAFATFLSGDSAVKGLNPLRDKVGQTVASETLTITDQAFASGGMAIRPFDDEGVASQDTDIVVDGVLTHLLHNTATAAYFGTQTTGNARRGAKSPLSVSPRHIVIQTSDPSDDAIIDGQVFEIVALEGLHSGSNGVTGEFSLKASGFYVEMVSAHKLFEELRSLAIFIVFYRVLLRLAKAKTGIVGRLSKLREFVFAVAPSQAHDDATRTISYRNCTAFVGLAATFATIME